MLFQTRTACEATRQFSVLGKEKAMQIEGCTTGYLNFSKNEILMRLLQKSKRCHSRSASERESGVNSLKNKIPDKGIRG